ncbi:hypothetical protein Nepgr_019865 [Nepenthes gracilis]|uniref:RING-type domain-containing protein n=1 Tax=Nepenthes gracilis TaxID=150966 RepID=A0AAD3SVY2_NEPGR|nr:hypothetical protein Nepgr_019865 [Nepenthes gracilis]
MAVQAHLYPETAYGSSPGSISMSPGIGFGDSFQYPVTQNQPQIHGIQNMGFGVEEGAVDPNGLSYPQSMPFSQSLAAEVQRQRREIDSYLRVQNERLKYAIQQLRKQQMEALLNQLETKTLALMRQKEQELAKVREKTEQLEEFLRKAEIETEVWQRAAKESEAMVMGLKNMLEQAKKRLPSSNGGAGEAAHDAESVCGSSYNSCSRKGERGKGKEMELKKMNGCKSCNSRVSCIVFLPCKHLCCCESCEALLVLCPVCQSVKDGSIEVFL